MNFARLLTLAVLGRVARLPAVWSNCLAGWWLGGGGNYWKLPFLFLGASVLYVGGACLNDAFDAEADRCQHPDRSIPAGKIPAPQVWRMGFSLLALGIFLLLFCGQFAAGAGFFLALSILLYNFSHQFFRAAPALLGACRFWVYIIASVVGGLGLNGYPIFCGLALAFFVAGSGFLVGRLPLRGLALFWTLVLLATPILLALLINTGIFRPRAVVLSLVVGSWIAYSIRQVIFGGDFQKSHACANLVAGICLVDWLAIVPDGSWWQWLFPALFTLTLVLRKLLPAA